MKEISPPAADPDYVQKYLICQKWDIKNWSVNADGTIDVDGDVWLVSKGLKELPLKFGKVSGHFNCHDNELTTLEGSPREVGRDFYCGNNKLTTLEGGPNKVGDSFICANNKLTGLEGAPSYVGGDFSCVHNKLVNLKGSPREVVIFDCSHNELTNLEGAPSKAFRFNCSDNKITTILGQKIDLIGGFFCDGNPIYDEFIEFNNYESYYNSLNRDFNLNLLLDIE
jgi:hypothetical protein